jgi:hypothetical protein
MLTNQQVAMFVMSQAIPEDNFYQVITSPANWVAQVVRGISSELMEKNLAKTIRPIRHELGSGVLIGEWVVTYDHLDQATGVMTAASFQKVIDDENALLEKNYAMADIDDVVYNNLSF